MALLIVVGFGSSGNTTVVRDHDRLWREVSPSGVAFAYVLYATGLWRLRCATLPGAMNWRARPWSRHAEKQADPPVARILRRTVELAWQLPRHQTIVLRLQPGDGPA